MEVDSQQSHIGLCGYNSGRSLK